MMNGRPITMRQKVRIMVALTILAWATQTLFHQWGYGNDLAAQERAGAAAGGSNAPKRSEKFVPGTARFAAGATLEMRLEATVGGAEVKLKQVCRWADRDAAVFGPIAELVLVRVPADAPFQAVTIKHVRQTLHDAGVNLGMVRFSGPTSCTITRGDVEYDEQQGLLEWARAKQPPQNDDVASTASDRETAAIAATQRVEEGSAESVVEDSAQKTLRDLLIHDLSVRLHVPRDDLHVTFNPKDDGALRLAEPQFKFDIQPKRVRNLGAVAWEVQVVTDGGGAARKSQKMAVAATARAWQRQVVLTKPLAFKQSIRDSDVTERRVLVDTLDDDPLLSRPQVVGQQAAREFKAGTLMTAKTVQAVPLARTGQFITVTLSRGGVSIKTVGRAMEEGSYGQTIKVKNEATKDVYEIVLTGPQEGQMGAATPAVTTVTAAQ